MTREKAVKTAWTKDIENLVFDIYADFESRACSNCKHYQEVDDLKYCYELDEYDMKYCDRFEREDNGIKEDH